MTMLHVSRDVKHMECFNAKHSTQTNCFVILKAAHSCCVFVGALSLQVFTKAGMDAVIVLRLGAAYKSVGMQSGWLDGLIQPCLDYTHSQSHTYMANNSLTSALSLQSTLSLTITTRLPPKLLELAQIVNRVKNSSLCISLRTESRASKCGFFIGFVVLCSKYHCHFIAKFSLSIEFLSHFKLFLKIFAGDWLIACVTYLNCDCRQAASTVEVDWWACFVHLTSCFLLSMTFSCNDLFPQC